MSRPRHPFDDRPINEIWQEYQQTRSTTLRNYLMEKYLPLVRYNAERIYTRLPDEVDIEDLMSAGIFGLKDAIASYDLDHKVKFETFCAPRIRGAILDELRAMDWVPRLVRHRSAKVEQARSKIEMELGRPATDDEIAQRLGVGAEEFDKIKRDSQAVGTRSITSVFPAGQTDDDTDIDSECYSNYGDPLQELQRRDLKTLITKSLSRSDRLLILLYYYEGLTMKEIGATFGLSESRVCQMHSSILARLKAHMQNQSSDLHKAHCSTDHKSVDARQKRMSNGSDLTNYDSDCLEQVFNFLITGNYHQLRAQYLDNIATGDDIHSFFRVVLWPLYSICQRLFRADQLTHTSQATAMRTLRRAVTVLGERLSRNKLPVQHIYVTSAPSASDEVGSLMLVYLLEHAGYNVVFGGTVTPIDELIEAAQLSASNVLVVFPVVANDLPWLRDLRDQLKDRGHSNTIRLAAGAGVFARAEGLFEELGIDLHANDPFEMVTQLVREYAPED